MHATLHRFEGAHGAGEEIILSTNRLASLLSRREGFVSFALLEIGECEHLAIVVFETGGGLAEADQFIACWAAEHLAGWLTGPAEVVTGEVIVQRGM
jgi:hypothetical protein